MSPASRPRSIQWTEEMLAEQRVMLEQHEARLARVEDYLTQLHILKDHHGPDYIVPKTLRNQYFEASRGDLKVSEEIPKIENQVRIINDGVGFHEHMVELGERALGYTVVYTPESTPE